MGNLQGAALCSAPRGKHRVNQALYCRTSWNPEYADVLCESIKGYIECSASQTYLTTETFIYLFIYLQRDYCTAQLKTLSFNQ